MGNQSSNSKFKQKSGSELAAPDQDFLHPANFSRQKSRLSRKSSDASGVSSGAGSGTKSDIVAALPRRFSGLSPRNLAKHKRNMSEGLGLRGTSPSNTVGGSHFPNDVSTLSTNSTWIKASDSDSEVSLLVPEISLETRDLSDNSEPSSATVRQSIKEKRDLAEASEIKPWLFLGGVEVAKSKEYLRSKGITHVLNCAHTVCENYHENEFKYVRPIDIADASKEEIGNFMLQAIADIESVREDKGKILVHCQLGSSRSATLVIAYLMWLENLDAPTAFAEVKKKRSIVSPNLGFMIQLNAFKRRLDWRPTEPTLHRIAPHSSTDGTLVVKLVVRADTKDPVLPRVEHLDPRGTFLLHSPCDKLMYLWVGPDVGLQAETEANARRIAREQFGQTSLRRNNSPPLRETYEQAGKRFGKIMCKYEKAFRDDNGNACQFVIVPTNQSAVLALAEGADQNSLAARFWKTLGETIGTKTSIDQMRANSQNKDWTEAGDSSSLAYIDSSTSAQFAVVDITPSDRSLLSDQPIDDGTDNLSAISSASIPVDPANVYKASRLVEQPLTPTRENTPASVTLGSPNKV